MNNIEQGGYKYWRESVKRILVSQGLISEAQELSDDIYKPYFNDGYSPAQAIKEDLGQDAIRFFNPNNKTNNT